MKYLAKTSFLIFFGILTSTKIYSQSIDSVNNAKNFVGLEILGESGSVGGLWYGRLIKKGKKTDFYLKGGLDVIWWDFGVNTAFQLDYLLNKKDMVYWKNSINISNNSFSFLYYSPYGKAIRGKDEEGIFIISGVPFIGYSTGLKQNFSKNFSIDFNLCYNQYFKIGTFNLSKFNSLSFGSGVYYKF